MHRLPKYSWPLAIIAVIATLASFFFFTNPWAGRSKARFAEEVRFLLPRPDDETVSRYFDQLDTNHNGRISDAEFESLGRILSAFANRDRSPTELNVEDKEADYDRHAFQALPADSFPVFDDPKMTAAVDTTLDDQEYVIGVVCDGEAKAYPVSVMGRHELGNDVCGTTQIAVSW